MTRPGGGHRIEVDDEGLTVIRAALDLLQRVAVGQWREVADHAPNVLGDTASGGGEVGEELIGARCRHTVDADLRHPNASLGIRRAHREAQVAYDLWHAVGGGMPERQGGRLTSVHVTVTSGP